MVEPAQPPATVDREGDVLSAPALPVGAAPSWSPRLRNRRPTAPGEVVTTLTACLVAVDEANQRTGHRRKNLFHIVDRDRAFAGFAARNYQGKVAGDEPAKPWCGGGRSDGNGRSRWRSSTRRSFGIAAIVECSAAFTSKHQAGAGVVRFRLRCPCFIAYSPDSRARRL